jgi:hypothetical protein
VSVAESAGLLSLGLAIGAYATAIGAGGGFLITPLLLLRYGQAAPAEITAASLLVVAVSSGLSTTVMARSSDRLAGCRAACGKRRPGRAAGRDTHRACPSRTVRLDDRLAARRPSGLPRVEAALAVRRSPRSRVATRVSRRTRRRVSLSRSPCEGRGGLSHRRFGRLHRGDRRGPFYVPLATRVLRIPHPLAVPAAHFAIATLALTVVLYHAFAGNFGEPLHDVV